MNEQERSLSFTIFKTMGTVLVAMLLVGALAFSLVMVSCPRVAYDVYAKSGNQAGAYLNARKLYASEDARLSSLSGAEAQEFNRQTRLPSLDVVVRIGLGLASNGKTARGLEGYFETMFADNDFLPFCTAMDNRAIKNTQQRAYHIYLVGHEGYLDSKHIEVLMRHDRQGAKQKALRGFETYVRKIDEVGIVSDGGITAYLNAIKTEDSSAMREELMDMRGRFEAKIVRTGDLARRVAQVVSGKAILQELYLARSLWRLEQAFGAVLQESNDTLTSHWHSELDRLLNIYTQSV